MSSYTPSRISLRRKRLNNELRQANPSPKRMSPSADNEAKKMEQTKVNSLKNFHEIANSIDSSKFLTPKGCRRRDKKPTITPTTSKESPKPNSDANEEFSPSQSFSCSQISSTQDCEVVWDCNSPGYSKEELKKMGGEPYDKTSPLSSAPNRLLFASKYKRPLPPTHLPLRLSSRVCEKSSEIVAAELDSLLTKVNGEKVKEIADLKEENKLLTIDVMLSMINEPSQPCNISEDGKKEDSLTKSAKIMENSVMSMKRVSNDTSRSNVKDNIVTSVDVYNGRSACPLSSNRINNENLNKEKEAVMDMSFSSMEDDDLFNESVLRSTQALEDAILNQEAQKTPKVTRIQVSPLSRIRKKTPVLFSDDLCDEIKSVNNSISNNCHTITKNNSNNLKKCNNQLKSSCTLVTKKPFLPLSVTEAKSSSVAGLNLQTALNGTRNAQIKSSYCSDNVSQKSFSKPHKPRATFQLEEPNGRSLGDVFNRKFCEISKVERNRSVDDCGLAFKLNVTEKEKFSRSKSETTYGSKSPMQQIILQDSDEDDEIFASLMPTLIAVEEEHSKKIASEAIGSSLFAISPNNVPRSIIAPSTKITHNNQNSSINITDTYRPSSNITNHHKKLSPNLDHHQKLPTNVTDYRMPFQAQIPIDNIKKKDVSKILFSNSKFKKTKSSDLENKKSSTRTVSSNKVNNVPISSCHDVLVDVKQADSSRKAITMGNNYDEEDDDDDIFLQDGVLDYISFVESQYMSSQTPSVEKTSPALSDSLASFLEPQLSVHQTVNRSTSVRPLSEPVPGVKERHFSHSRDKKKTFGDAGSHFLKQELLKVGQTTAKLNQVLKSERSVSFASSLNVNLRATGSSAVNSRDDAVKAPNHQPNTQNSRGAFKSTKASFVMPTYVKPKE